MFLVFLRSFSGSTQSEIYPTDLYGKLCFVVFCDSRFSRTIGIISFLVWSRLLLIFASTGVCSSSNSDFCIYWCPNSFNIGASHIHVGRQYIIVLYFVQLVLLVFLFEVIFYWCSRLLVCAYYDLSVVSDVICCCYLIYFVSFWLLWLCLICKCDLSYLISVLLCSVDWKFSFWCRVILSNVLLWILGFLCYDFKCDWWPEMLLLSELLNRRS